MKILVINCGSSSFKYQLLDMDGETLLCSGLVDRIGMGGAGKLTYKKYTAGEVRKYENEQKYSNHTDALKDVLKLFTDPEWGVIKSIEDIGAVGHRIVQGGEIFTRSCVVTPKERDEILKLSALAPLHNPAHVQGIDVAMALCPHAPSVAVFDTEFHATMPPRAYRYALPNELYEKDKIRRYGAHGTSHRYVSREAAKFLGKPLTETNLITCHLGNGSSVTAVQGGKSIDTSMGLTPLAGLVMGTRCGDVDPAIAVYLGRNKKMGPDEIDTLFNKKSGLFALCGMSDMRDIHSAREAGDKNAALAFDILCYSLRRYIGAYWAVLTRVDGIVFTAGIGENDPEVRAESLAGLESWGVKIDPARNAFRSDKNRYISTDDSKIPVMVIPTNEELEIARATLAVLRNK